MRNEARAAMRAGTVEQINEEVGGFDLPESDSKEFSFKSVFTGDGFKKAFGKMGMRNLVIVLSVLLIGAAVYANWRIFGTEAPVDNPTGNNNGAVNTDTNSEYFAASQVERQRARDEAIEVLQSVVDNVEEADADAKAEAM